MKYIFFLLALSSFIWSSIGNIGVVKGNADIVRNVNKLKVKSGMELEVEDKIITKEKSRVQAILKDNTIVTIGQNSIFVFDRYKFGTKDDSQADMHIERGFFRSITGKIGKIAPSRFNIKTVSTTIGIRGTDFSAFVSDKKEIITCHRGRISVAIEGKTYIVDEGKQLILVTTPKKKKKSSGSDDEDTSSFSIEISDSMSSLENIQSQVSTDTNTNKNRLNNAGSITNSMSALDQIDTGTLDEVNKRDAMAPLENPTVDFPDR